MNGAIGVWLGSSLLSAVAGRRVSHGFRSALLFAGSILAVASAIMGWDNNVLWEGPAPIYFGVVPLVNRLDSLSSVFVGLLGVIGVAVSLFSPGYLAHLDKRMNDSVYWSCLFLFVLSMCEVVLAANALTFLVFCELMSLSSAVLVASDLANKSAHRSAFIYLGATRFASALLFVGFLWFHAIFGSWDFSVWHLDSADVVMPTLLVLIGLCIKAGIWPFHLWLPYAHPAAPTPVSALMSGVMIKIALYAVIRLLVFGGLESLSIAYLMLFLGIVSAFWGVLFALMQHDLKRLLAYHSVENVGLILMGIALCLIGRSCRLEVVAAIGLCAAVFHCVNHGLFKSLLFFGAGAIDARAHTRDLSLLGGLGKAMPWTMACFLIGSAAICALPPLNGFASKWLVYQSLFKLACFTHSPVDGGIAFACMGTLGLVGGLALACFTKAVGITFLGRPRSHEAERAREVTPYMIAAQLLLVVCCLGLGAAAPLVMRVIQPICNNGLSSFVDLEAAFSIPTGMLTVTFAVTAFLIYWLVLGGSKAPVKRHIAWECGFGDLTARMQAAATSFAQPIGHIFRPLLQYHLEAHISGRDRRHFPDAIVADAEMVSLLESRVYGPVVDLLRWMGGHVAKLQAGSIHLYLGYMLLTLLALMMIGFRL